MPKFAADKVNLYSLIQINQSLLCKWEMQDGDLHFCSESHKMFLENAFKHIVILLSFTFI